MNHINKIHNVQLMINRIIIVTIIIMIALYNSN